MMPFIYKKNPITNKCRLRGMCCTPFFNNDIGGRDNRRLESLGGHPRHHLYQTKYWNEIVGLFFFCMSCTLTKELMGFDTLEVRKPETKALLNCHAKDYFTSTEYFLRLYIL